MALLEIKNLSIELKSAEGYIRMVDNVSLSMAVGEIHGLVGESGSGKSLIGQTILGLAHPSWRVTADRMIWDGKNLLEMTDVQRRQLMGADIAMIFQEPSTYLDPSLTIGDQLEARLSIEKRSLRFWKDKAEKRKKLKNWLHRVGIKNFDQLMRCYPWELSEGLCQKVMIIMAIVNKPRLLIADEPTNQMEHRTQAQIFRLLTKLNLTQELSILLISHDIESISSWTDRLTVLYCGQVVESGSSTEILESPYHPYVQALLDNVALYGRHSRAPSDMPALRGHIPSLQHLPTGCRLGPRCPFAGKPCVQFPEQSRLKNHVYYCHFPLIKEDVDANSKR